MSGQFDVIVIGAGPAGLSFAHSLSHTELSVLLLDQAPLSQLQAPEEDGREIALTHLSRNLMQASGAWQRIDEAEIAPIKAAKVFDGDSPKSLDFERQDDSLDALGYLVPNHLIRQACFENLEECSNITLKAGTRVKEVIAGDQATTVILDSGEKLSAALVVAADTRFSESRRQMGLAASMRDFSRVAIVCRMSHTRSHEQTAFECFHYGRTTAILPMNGNCSSVVVTVNRRQAEQFLSMSDARFSKNIQDQLHGQLGDMTLLGKRHTYPLVGVHAHQFVTERFALIGDAAVGMHPVTAHGFNLGLRGQALLAEKVAQAHACGEDIGQLTLLKSYEKEQMQVSRVLYHGTNLVVGLFTNESLPGRQLRKAVLAAAEHLPPVKKLITNSLTDRELKPLVPLPPIPAALPRPRLPRLFSV
ncbi:5-demethoxyubiquinol-8 5-hydroxylase UbiM [Neptunomonas sp. XY-337]|uniref:5-demethoxyubiquinol-8 5-hydroxylase UbiM n=1 Tax=Neptunomonas sp. XY-337 TaxID=2561897 RepID=UPI0010A9C6B0|nr:5-demethoxyubiquinol-8 5-hydroxylase UbiM [Neptunomonas sp. XY-337]